MTRNLTITMMCAFLAAANLAVDASARGFGGGGGGFRGGGGGYGGGGFRGGGVSYGGAASYSRTPSYSSMNRVGSAGVGGASAGYGRRSGSYTTQRGTTIDYGGAGAGVRGPYGGGAGRAVGGVQVTTPGGRTATKVGRAGGTVGPYGNAVGGRSSVGVASGPRGTVAGGSRAATAVGPGGAVRAGERGAVGVGPGGAVRVGERGAVGVGPGGAVRVGERGAVGVGPGGAFAARGYGVSAARPYGYNAFGAYHAGWVHGYWNGHGGAAWGWNNPQWAAWGLGLATGLGWGLASWGFGSALYGMGYMPYSNPYYQQAPVVAVSDQPVMAAPYDYSQPIDTVSAPPAEAVASPAMTSFDSARDAFKQGNYGQALKLANDAMATAPNDTALHEFRGLCLFALGRYDDAAASIYAVLSVGPGWDWTTMISLYPGPEPYTAQLRALENFCKANPSSAAGRFVLAYHYLTEGYTDVAADTYKQVVKLMPSDTLSAKLLRQLEPSTEEAAPASGPAPVTADTAPPTGGTIDGTWTAKPTPDTSIRLTIQPAGPFTWEVNQKGKAQSFGGTSTYDEGVLTLTQDKGPVLVGRVSWMDPTHMTFRIAGDAPQDSGLSFSK